MPNFIWMCSLCRLPVAKKNNNFGQILTFWGLLYRPPSTHEGQIWCVVADPRYMLTLQISSWSVYSVALCWRKTAIFAVFWTSAFSVVANWHSLTKLNTGAQLQTFPYPTAWKSFLYSNTFIAKSGAQSVTFKSVTNKQRNRQKNSTFLATPAAGEIRAPPHLAWW